MHRLHLAKERGDVIEQELVQKPAAYLFVAMRQKCSPLRSPTIASS
jgi:hypothetical protein